MSYIVVIEDYYRNKIEVEVSKEVYEVFQEDKRGAKAQNQADYRHGCSMMVEHDTTSYIARKFHPSLEEEYLLREHLQEVLEIINSCSKIQKQRFYFNRILGYSFV